MMSDIDSCLSACLSGSNREKLHLLILFPKFGRADTFVFTEQSIQMALIGKSKFFYDFIDSHVGM